MPFQPARVGLHFQIQEINATETTAREFLTNRNVLCSDSVCSRCNNAMTLKPCSEKKSPDLYTWKCVPWTKFTSIRARSVLSGSKLSLSIFVLLIFYFSSKSLSNIEIAAYFQPRFTPARGMSPERVNRHKKKAAYTGLSEEAVESWSTTFEGSIVTWIIFNPSPLGGLS